MCCKNIIIASSIVLLILAIILLFIFLGTIPASENDNLQAINTRSTAICWWSNAYCF